MNRERGHNQHKDKDKVPLTTNGTTYSFSQDAVVIYVSHQKLTAPNTMCPKHPSCVFPIVSRSTAHPLVVSPLLFCSLSIVAFLKLSTSNDVKDQAQTMDRG